MQKSINELEVVFERKLYLIIAAIGIFFVLLGFALDESLFRTIFFILAAVAIPYGLSSYVLRTHIKEDFWWYSTLLKLLDIRDMQYDDLVRNADLKYHCRPDITDQVSSDVIERWVARYINDLKSYGLVEYVFPNAVFHMRITAKGRMSSLLKR